MFFIRHSIRTASELVWPALASRATPPTWVNFSSSFNPAGRGHDSHGSPGAVIGATTASEAREEDLYADLRKAEVSLSSLSHTAPGDEPRPEVSRRKSPSARQPSHGQKTRDRRRPQRAPETKEYLRFVRIFGLSADTTFADILAGIAQTAPVGRVLSIEWDKQGVVRHRGMEVKAAMVLFDHDAAAADLVRLAKQQTFLVRSESVFVSIWANRAFHGNNEAETASRVIHIRGPRDVEDFSEEGIRNLLLENAMAVKALGPLGLDAEAVVTTEVGGGKRLIEWRFFSNERQAKIVLFLLRRVFHKSLSVGFGPDPCWNEQLYPRGRTGHRDARLLPALSKGFEESTMRETGRIRGGERIYSVLEERSRGAAWERDQMPWETARRDSRPRESSTSRQPHLFHKNPPPLDKRQQERILAWTQAGHLAMEVAQDDHRHDRQQGRRSRTPKERQKEPSSASTEAQVSQDQEDPFQQLFKETIFDPKNRYPSKF